jgi:Tfp pilus assembly protein FimT
MRNQSGLTVIGLMMAFAIVAILASLATPNFIAWLPNYRLQSGAEEIHSTLQLARVRAIKQNATVTVTFNTANETYQASVEGQTYRRGQMPAGIDINSAVFGGGAFVQFDSRGATINNTDGSVQLRNNSGRTQTITVSITGNARIN